MKNTFIVFILLIICLMTGVGCKETPAQQPQEKETAAEDLALLQGFKGPVKAMTVTKFYGEGEPSETRYEFNEKGKVISEKDLTEYYGDDDLNEALSEKDAKGRYTKQVWGTDDEIYSYQLFQYDDNGNVTFAEYHQGDGTVNSTTWNTYDAAGHQLSSTTQSSYGTNVSTYEYDDKGNLVKDINTSNGNVTNVTTYQRDEAGRETMMHSQNPVSGYESWSYTSYDKDGTQIGWTSYSKDENGSRLNRQDTVFFDQNGLKHARAFEDYGDPRTYESTYNKQGYITHFEQFEGTASHPTYVADFTYNPDGATLREMTCKQMVLGQEKATRTKAFSEELDTFGNWTRRVQGPSYNFAMMEFGLDDFEDSLTSIYRKIEYRGEDQGQNYGFTGKAGNADIRLTHSFDGYILCGELTIDGNTWRAVGTRDEDDGLLYVVALKENGDIPWSLTIPSGDGTREGTLFKGGDEPIPATFTPTREGLKTYSFATTPDEIVGIYEFDFPGDMPTGKLDVSRTGEDWKEVHFNLFRSGTKSSLNMAQDEFDDVFGRTDYYRYCYNDDTDTSFSYEIYFFDGFAVIKMSKWNEPDVPTVQGIYAKLPAVG